jgi:uncharacterized membrane protein YoaK (UPF0700 family)
MDRIAAGRVSAWRPGGTPRAAGASLGAILAADRGGRHRAVGDGRLGLAAVPLLSAAMAMQNAAVRHGVVAVNVGFVSGDIQQLGERLVAETVPAPPSKKGPQAPVILTILVCYAFGAAIGALASGLGASALFAPAAVLAAAVLLPERWTGLAAQRH